MPIDRATFALQRQRTFGTANPSLMRVAFWEEMVRTGQSAAAARYLYDPGGDSYDGAPVWTFRRYGPTRTQLSDGSVLCVGGEHEDGYDPDFCIYNDVVVVRPDASFQIYGYPRDLFPPTDFHTATLAGDRLLLIGGLGYRDERGGPHTPVFSLDTRTLSITRVSTTGTSPGWIYQHRATLTPDGSAIRIAAGNVIQGRGRDEKLLGNTGDFELCLRTFQWRQVEPTPEPDRPPEIDWPYPWVPVRDPHHAYELRRQLLTETFPGHPLFAANVRAWAESHLDDPVLFKLLDGTNRLAQLPLAYSEHDFDPPGPPTTFFPSLDAWLASVQPTGPHGDA